MPEPEDLDFERSYPQLQAENDAFLAGLANDPDSYSDPRRADPEFEATTPDEFTDGSVWAPQRMITSTTKPERPRTRTAGYDSKNYILTVQFRDGTLWNYYDVNPHLWDAFRSSDSKHEFIESALSGWPNMGPVVGASPKQMSGIKGLGSISSKTQKKTYIGGASRNTPFGGKL